MYKYIFALLISCGSDIAIITREKVPDTAESSVVDSSVEDTDTTQEPDFSEPSDEMTDLTIGFAQVSLTQIACPACMGVSYEFDISADLKLHEPTSGGYSDLLTPIGTCSTQQLTTQVNSTPIDVPGLASFNSIQLYPAGPSQWTSSGLQEYQIPRRESITVITDSGTIPNAFETLEGFDDIQPWELRYVDPSYAFAAVVSKAGTTFTWYPTIPGTQFEVLIVVYSPDGSQILGLVTCMENDAGYMYVPGNYFTAYPYYSLAAVYLTRHRVQRTAAPDFNGWLESHQTWTVLGTAHIE